MDYKPPFDIFFLWWGCVRGWEPLKPREFNIEVVATYVYDIFTAIFHLPPPISSLTTPERICISSTQVNAGERIWSQPPNAFASPQPRWTQVNAFELEKPQVNAFACRLPITLQFHPRASNMSGQVCLLMLPPLSLRPFWVLSSSWLRIHIVTMEDCLT